MKEIVVPDVELFDEDACTYSRLKGQTLLFEHSLKSISKWESIWRKPFLHMDHFTPEQIASYTECMLITKKVNPNVYTYFLTNMPDELNDLWEYVKESQTATWFSEVEGASKHSSNVLTSERLYYYMSALGINWEAQYWHISRLIALIRIGNEENKPKKKMSAKQSMQYQSSINKARRAERAAKHKK